MDIPENILSELTCNRCETYLKGSPIYLKHDGKPVCSSCLDPKDKVQATRNQQYEALAQLMKFPCKYQEFGCKKTFVFGKQDHHESACRFKQFLCPVAESGKCEWLGQRNQFLKHCEEEHPDQVVKNPCTLTHDILKSSSSTYLLNACLNVLFLLQTKVCVASGKIYHSVRYLGNPGEANKYSYTLKVKRNDLEMSKPGKVAPEGCLALQENSSLALNINGLLEFLDGFNNTTFFITVRRSCKNQSKGCAYVDTSVKCVKHEKYFCDYSKCILCKSYDRQKESKMSHYHHKHNAYIHNQRSPWSPSGYEYKDENGICREFCFITSEVGTVICEWSKEIKVTTNDYKIFGYKIYAPVCSEKLRTYNCTFIECILMKVLLLGPKSSIFQCDSLEDWSYLSTWQPWYDDICLFAMHITDSYEDTFAIRTLFPPRPMRLWPV